MTTTVLRTLADVQTDLSLVLQRKTCDMVWVGRLLNEAKGLVEHGEWLEWLRRYTALSARSAQNYMKAAAFADAIAAKSETVSHFDLNFLSPKGSIFWPPAGTAPKSSSKFWMPPAPPY
jgi:hypothetical protein